MVGKWLRTNVREEDARYWAIMLAATPLLFGYVGNAQAADLLYDPYGAWNGYKVYLSPARHSDAGSRGECNGANENTMAAAAASVATNGNYYQDVVNYSSGYRNLRARGYKVRIGNGTVRSAIDNSNAWGANIHIAMHSNASANRNCDTTNAGAFGTNTIYRDGRSSSQSLANGLRTALYDASPGTNDYTCYNPGHPCTTIDLAELRDPRAVPAYSETEFHNWTRGVNFLQAAWWPWRIGIAVDSYLGYPR